MTSQKEDIVQILNPPETWQQGGFVQLNQHKALLLSLQENKAIALLMKRTQSLPQGEINAASHEFKLAWGQFNTVHQEQGSVKLTLKNQMKAEVIRELNSEQLVSGHMRIDLVRPLTRGNFILFKGERSTGKTQVALDVIKQFLSENSSNKAVYVSLSTQGRDVSQQIASD